MSGEQQRQSASVSSARAERSILDEIAAATEVRQSSGAAGQTERPKLDESTRGWLKALLQEAMKGTLVWDRNLSLTIRKAIAAIDDLLSKQVAEIMHHPDFKKLEGSWRGLHFLVDKTETGDKIRLKVMHCSKRDLTRDLEKATDFDQSEIYKKIYGPFDAFGAAPFGAIVGDYEFENTIDDLDCLTRVSKVAAAAHCPFLSAASPNLMGFNSWQQLPNVRDLSKIFQTKEYVQWRAFRDSPASCYVTLTMPRVLARVPYGSKTKPIDEFSFEEVELGVDGKPKTVDHEKYVWTNAAYALASRLTNAFDMYGFCTSIRGVENGGKVDGLPVHIFQTDEGDWDQKCPTEVAIGGTREYELSKLGFMPLAHFADTPYAVFIGAQTAQKPKTYMGERGAEATANAAICARLPYLMAASRLSHYMKAMVRDKIGSFMERADIERYLNDWLANYKCASGRASSESERRRYPLKEYSVQVEEIPGRPGAYHVVLHLCPWLQLEELTTSMRMVAEIPWTKK